MKLANQKIDSMYNTNPYQQPNPYASANPYATGQPNPYATGAPNPYAGGNPYAAQPAPNPYGSQQGLTGWVSQYRIS